MTNMSQLIATTERTLMRDMHSKALLCVDTQALQRHRKTRRMTEEHAQMQKDLTQLRSDVEKLYHVILNI